MNCDCHSVAFSVISTDKSLCKGLEYKLFDSCGSFSKLKRLLKLAEFNSRLTWSSSEHQHQYIISNVMWNQTWGFQVVVEFIETTAAQPQKESGPTHRLSLTTAVLILPFKYVLPPRLPMVNSVSSLHTKSFNTGVVKHFWLLFLRSCLSSGSWPSLDDNTLSILVTVDDATTPLHGHAIEVILLRIENIFFDDANIVKVWWLWVQSTISQRFQKKIKHQQQQASFFKTNEWWYYRRTQHVYELQFLLCWYVDWGLNMREQLICTCIIRSNVYALIHDKTKTHLLDNYVW